jgi:hypothetical protein
MFSFIDVSLTSGLLRGNHPRNDINTIKTQTGRECHDPFCGRNENALFSGLLFFLDLNDFAAFVVTAIRANRVGQALGSAIGAGDCIYRGQCVLRTAAITASLGMFALWMWGHEYFLLYTYIRRACARLDWFFNEAR